MTDDHKDLVRQINDGITAAFKAFQDHRPTNAIDEFRELIARVINETEEIYGLPLGTIKVAGIEPGSEPHTLTFTFEAPIWIDPQIMDALKGAIDKETT